MNIDIRCSVCQKIMTVREYPVYPGTGSDTMTYLVEPCCPTEKMAAATELYEEALDDLKESRDLIEDLLDGCDSKELKERIMAELNYRVSYMEIEE